jgi:putative addiction module component (TIGR02574 family)
MLSVQLAPDVERRLAALAKRTGRTIGDFACVLIEQLGDSLSDADVPLTDAQKAALGRRMATFDRNRAGAVPWDELKVELALRCP